MSTQQAEQVLKHTFKQLERMLDDVRREGTGLPPGNPAGGKNTRKNPAGPGKQKK